MITILKDKHVKIRKEHMCFSCYRKFPIGTIMHYGTYVDDKIYSLYTCSTCEQIMDLEKDETEFKYGYVNNELNKNETPEQLLEKLKSK
jgi:hypothetical protein